MLLSLFGVCVVVFFLFKQKVAYEMLMSDWSSDLCSSDLDDWLARLFSGAELPQGADPLAFAYAGHQFGHFSPQLGDGRALLLGELVAPDGARFDVQLKGSGPTPFSRNGDGKAAVGDRKSTRLNSSH